MEQVLEKPKLDCQECLNGNCQECLQSEARGRAVQSAHRLNIPEHKLKTGGMVGVDLPDDKKESKNSEVKWRRTLNL